MKKANHKGTYFIDVNMTHYHSTFKRRENSFVRFYQSVTDKELEFDIYKETIHIHTEVTNLPRQKHTKRHECCSGTM